MTATRRVARTRWRVSAALLVILLIAAALRLYRIDVFPPGLYADVAANGLDAFHLSLNSIQILYDRGQGNSIEGLIVWLEWPVMQLVGRGPIFVYLTTVLIGLVILATNPWFSNPAEYHPVRSSGLIDDLQLRGLRDHLSDSRRTRERCRRRSGPNSP